MLMIVEVTRKNKIKILQAPAAAVQIQVRTQIRPVQVRPHRRLHQVVEVVQVQARKRRKKLRKNIRNDPPTGVYFFNPLPSRA